MFIQTQFELGHKFWVPRVRWDHSKESIEVNGETYYREIKKLVSYAKPKTLIEIEVSVCIDQLPQFKYWVRNGHGDEVDFQGMVSLCHPNDMKYIDEKSARDFAEQYELIYGRSYYGEPL